MVRPQPSSTRNGTLVPDTTLCRYLVGTGPRGGVPSQDHEMPVHARSTDEKTGDSPLEAFLYLFFSPADAGRKAGEQFWERRHRRTENKDVPAGMQAIGAQLAAMQA